MKDDALRTLARGALGRCPKCGQGRLFGRYLKVVECCAACGEPYGHYRADDAPPWLTILIVGHITVPLILFAEEMFEPPPWVEFAIYLPAVLLFTLLILPRCKGVILAILWRMKAEGSEVIHCDESPRPDVPATTTGAKTPPRPIVGRAGREAPDRSAPSSGPQ